MSIFSTTATRSKKIAVAATAVVVLATGGVVGATQANAQEPAQQSFWVYSCNTGSTYTASFTIPAPTGGRSQKITLANGVVGTHGKTSVIKSAGLRFYVKWYGGVASMPTIAPQKQVTVPKAAYHKKIIISITYSDRFKGPSCKWVKPVA